MRWLIKKYTKRPSEKIIYFFEIAQTSRKSNAKSLAFASAVKTEEPFGIHIVSERLSDTTAHPTFISSLEPAIYMCL